MVTIFHSSTFSCCFISYIWAGLLEVPPSIFSHLQFLPANQLIHRPTQLNRWTQSPTQQSQWFCFWASLSFLFSAPGYDCLFICPATLSHLLSCLTALVSSQLQIFLCFAQGAAPVCMLCGNCAAVNKFWHFLLALLGVPDPSHSLFVFLGLGESWLLHTSPCIAQTLFSQRKKQNHLKKCKRWTTQKATWVLLLQASKAWKEVQWFHYLHLRDFTAISTQWR